MGKLAFFTALGIPDNGIFDIPIRDIDPSVPGQAVEQWVELMRIMPSGRTLG